MATHPPTNPHQRQPHLPNPTNRLHHPRHPSRPHHTNQPRRSLVGPHQPQSLMPTLQQPTHRPDKTKPMANQRPTHHTHPRTQRPPQPPTHTRPRTNRRPHHRPHHPRQHTERRPRPRGEKFPGVYLSGQYRSQRSARRSPQRRDRREKDLYHLHQP